MRQYPEPYLWQRSLVRSYSYLSHNVCYATAIAITIALNLKSRQSAYCGVVVCAVNIVFILVDTYDIITLMIQNELKKYFWDVDFDKIDIQKNKRFVLERILELGDEKAVDWMKRSFSNKEMLEALKDNKRISKKSLNFWNLILSA